MRSNVLWRNADFLLLWSGQAVSALGSSVSRLALPLLTLALTHSPAQAGFIAALQSLPYLLFSLPAGALIDRWDRKRVMIRCLPATRLLASCFRSTTSCPFPTGSPWRPMRYRAASTASSAYWASAASRWGRLLAASYVSRSGRAPSCG